MELFQETKTILTTEQNPELAAVGSGPWSVIIGRTGEKLEIVSINHEPEVAKSWAASHGKHFDEIVVITGDLAFRIWKKVVS